MPKKKGFNDKRASRFVQTVADGYHANARYCFILGSGASRSAGIPTGQELMEEWRTFLLDREKEDGGYIAECAQECGMTDEAQWKSLFAEGRQLQSRDYFDLYDLRFPDNPIAGYHYLQEKMEQASPSVGHFMLAAILEQTNNKFVITTNFDTLVEDALYLYHGKRPAVAGHESLASFINNTELKDRPIVAKIHRDLMLRPLNRLEELKKLDEKWVDSLTTALSQYIPIVIGYGGGDRTLMNLLKEIKPKTIYWCTVKRSEVLNNQDIQEILRQAEQGCMVKIQSFDRIMYELYHAMMDSGSETVEINIRTLFDKILSKYSVQYKEVCLSKKYFPDESILDKKPEGILSKRKLKTLVDRKMIATISFRDTRIGLPDNVIDLSEADDYSVVGLKVGSELIIAGDGGVAAPANCYNLFEDWERLERVCGADCMDTSQVTNMSCMFLGCTNLKEIDVGKWDTSRVSDMTGMFYGCSSLTALDINSWNISSVKYMKWMFLGCKWLRELDVSNWDVSRVRDKSNMFMDSYWEYIPPIK